MEKVKKVYIDSNEINNIQTEINNIVVVIVIKQLGAAGASGRTDNGYEVQYKLLCLF